MVIDFLLTFSARAFASRACCSQSNARSIALSFSNFIPCIFFLIASMVVVFVPSLVHQENICGRKSKCDYKKIFVISWNSRMSIRECTRSVTLRPQFFKRFNLLRNTVQYTKFLIYLNRNRNIFSNYNIISSL